MCVRVPIFLTAVARPQTPRPQIKNPHHLIDWPCGCSAVLFVFICIWSWFPTLPVHLIFTVDEYSYVCESGFFFEGIPELFTLIDLQIYTHNCEWMRVARGCYSNEMCQTLTAHWFTINKTFSPKTGKKYTFIKNKCTQTFRWIFFSLSTNWLWTWKVYIKLMQMYMMIASESWSDLWQKIDKIRQCLWICQ